MEAGFYAGNYQTIVSAHVDAAHADLSPANLPFVVGALAFVGRLEEARALLASQLRGGAAALDGSHVVAARFFLGVAYCRAGRIGEARREFLLNARQRRGSPRQRFYIFQGLGCHRFFTGRLKKSAAHALLALEHAFRADFPYGRLLATDLRGHALVQLGQVQSGLSVLETARALARSLALDGNLAALDCSLAIYRARFGVLPLAGAMAALSALIGRPELTDSYSERSVRLELAVQTAFAGDADSAYQLLDRFGMERIPDGGDARARIRFLLACACVARLRRGIASMRLFVSEARALLGQACDIVLEIEALCLDLVGATEPGEASRIRVELRELCERSGIERRFWHGFACANELFPPPVGAALDRDRLGTFYLACQHPSPELALELLESGRLGLLSPALGLAPGRRLLVVRRRLIADEHGNARLLGEPSEGTLRLLLALSGGERRTKEELVGSVWGIAAYRPAAHDAVVHTAMSRLRAQLGPYAHWVEPAMSGYRLASGVEVVRADDGEPGSTAAPDTASEGRARGSPRRASSSGSHAPEPLLTLLAQNGAISSRDLAARLGVSEMTALRRLREFVNQGAIVRCGKGKNTRYRLLGNAS